MRCWSQGVVSPSPEEAVASFLAFNNYMRDLLAEKRKDRQDDLVSALLDAQVDGEALSEQEPVNFCVSLLGAGFETTEHLIGNILPVWTSILTPVNRCGPILLYCPARLKRCCVFALWCTAWDA